MKFAELQRLQSSHDNATQVIRSNTINSNRPSWVREASFIYCMLNLNTTLQILKRHKIGLTFTDDVALTSKVKDVTDLVREFRNSCCHVESALHEFGESNYERFNLCGGKMILMSINGIEYGCEYEDDVAVFSGDLKIYLRRHILRCLEEAHVIVANHEPPQFD